MTPHIRIGTTRSVAHKICASFGVYLPQVVYVLWEFDNIVIELADRKDLIKAELTLIIY